ncbi:MAG TPA: A24 family peptidase [Methyloceanibacter sp.]|nr:A24 family peptidase [Methyloceanibacter sp.]
MMRHRRIGHVAGAIAVALGLCITALSFYAFPPRVALVSCLLGWTMLAIAAIDARRLRIPDMLSLPAIPAGLLASGYLLDPASGHLVSLDHVIGACVGGASLWLLRKAYFRLRGREGLGLGDVKLASAAGAWTGWDHLSHVLLLAAVLALGLVIALALVRRKGLSGSEKIAFGSFLAPSIWIVWVVRAYAQGL